MGDLSRHFSRSEFACKCSNPQCAGKQATPERLLIVGLEELRNHAASGADDFVRILISWNNGAGSGCRCPEHDMAVRHKDSTGQHALWRAADVRMEQRIAITREWCPMSPETVARWAENCPVWQDNHGGIGIADTFVHLDVRPGPGARWRY